MAPSDPVRVRLEGFELDEANARLLERAGVLLDLSEQVVRTIPRLGVRGHGIADVRILALRGQKKEALVALREAEKAGWRQSWRYARDVDPSLASIRSEPEFRSIFADIERDMARQRAELATRQPSRAPAGDRRASGMLGPVAQMQSEDK